MHVEKNLAKKILKLVSSYRKIARYKVNRQNLISFLYTSNQKVEFETKITIPVILAPSKNEIFSCKSNKICTKSMKKTKKLS